MTVRYHRFCDVCDVEIPDSGQGTRVVIGLGAQRLIDLCQPCADRSTVAQLQRLAEQVGLTP